jgi:thiamine biosynthesis lipoprotein
MGSLASITIEAEPALADSILGRMQDLLLEIEIDTDPFGDGSLGTLNRLGRGVPGPHAARLLEAADALGRATGYALDPTVAPLVALWGFHGTPAVPDSAAVDSVLALTGWAHVHSSGDTIILDPGASLDLGAIAPGYAADMLYELAVGMGAEAALVEVGGEIRCGGRPWTIAVRHPRSDGFWGGVEVADGAVSTSGDYENFIEVDGVRFCHILDPCTGWPEQGVASVTVMAPTCLIADGLSTALAVRGPALLDSLPDSLWSGAMFLVVSGDTLVERRFGGM